MRDRLIELLKTPHKAEKLRQTGTAIGEYEDDCVEAMIADFLLANGVVVPPCKVGATVYEMQRLRNRIQPYEVITVKYNGHFWYMLWKLKNDEGIYGNLEGFVDDEIGKTVFLTREEAEQAFLHEWGYEGMRKDLYNLPITDVAEVKHGEWIYHECVSSYDGAISGYSCSCCSAFIDEEVYERLYPHNEFCPCCGAKMKGE